MKTLHFNYGNGVSPV